MQCALQHAFIGAWWWSGYCHKAAVGVIAKWNSGIVKLEGEVGVILRKVSKDKPKRKNLAGKELVVVAS